MTSKNKYTRGQSLGGRSKSNPSITYNDKTESLEMWAKMLQTTAGALRIRLIRAEKGEITWKEAMSDKEGRRTCYIVRRRLRRNAAAKEKRILMEKAFIDKTKIEDHLEFATNKFLYEQLV